MKITLEDRKALTDDIDVFILSSFKYKEESTKHVEYRNGIKLEHKIFKTSYPLSRIGSIDCLFKCDIVKYLADLITKGHNTIIMRSLSEIGVDQPSYMDYLSKDVYDTEQTPGNISLYARFVTYKQCEVDDV